MTDLEEGEVIEEVVEKAIPVDPLMVLLQLRHEYTTCTLPAQQDEKASIQEKILTILRENNMAPYYKLLGSLYSWSLDQELIDRMEKANMERCTALDAKIRDAEENLGDSDVRDSLLEKAEFYGTIGDREQCIKFNEECSGRTLGVGPRLDLAFQRIRVGFGFEDTDLIVKGIATAHELLKNHGDWERRNRLKVYEGLYMVKTRKFAKATELLVDSISTFSCSELIDFTTFTAITTCVALVTLDRPNLKKKIIDNSDVSAVMKETPHIHELLTSLYQCKYKNVFPALIHVCDYLLSSVFLTEHANYYFREVRILAFQQFLESYRSATLQSMSSAFGITVDVLDAQLCSFAVSGRLFCRIDRVSGNVHAEKADKVNYYYRNIVKHGDILLNNIQKLSRVAGM